MSLQQVHASNEPRVKCMGGCKSIRDRKGRCRSYPQSSGEYTKKMNFKLGGTFQCGMGGGRRANHLTVLINTAVLGRCSWNTNIPRLNLSLAPKVCYDHLYQVYYMIKLIMKMNISLSSIHLQFNLKTF